MFRGLVSPKPIASAFQLMARDERDTYADLAPRLYAINPDMLCIYGRLDDIPMVPSRLIFADVMAALAISQMVGGGTQWFTASQE